MKVAQATWATSRSRPEVVPAERAAMAFRDAMSARSSSTKSSVARVPLRIYVSPGAASCAGTVLAETVSAARLRRTFASTSSHSE